MTFDPHTIPASMLAVAIATPGGPEALTIVNEPVPELKNGDVLIRVAAAGVNGPDMAQRRGVYAPPPDASPLPGLEVSGEIVAIGSDVTQRFVGERVVALCNGGGYAEYVAVPAGQVLPLPKGWALVDGAALPETYFTVMQTLVMRSRLEAGMHVLVYGAAGGIGSAAIQIVGALGALPIAIVSSAEKAQYALSLGAVASIDHSNEDVVLRTLALTDGKGADRIVDLVGGDTTVANIDASARGGHIVLVATQGSGKAPMPLAKLLMKQLTISGSTLRPQTPATKAAIADRLLADIWPHLGTPDWAHPRIRRYDLNDAVEAHKAFEQRDSFGKIVLVTSFGSSAID